MHRMGDKKHWFCFQIHRKDDIPNFDHIGLKFPNLCCDILHLLELRMGCGEDHLVCYNRLRRY
jgi:hypothetical protein